MSDLMKKRYKLTQPYPWCPWEVGEILSPDETGELYGKYAGYPASKWKVFEHEAINMPHIFKPLAWYEDRELSELPKYVKHEGLGTVCKIEFYRLSGKMPYITVIDGTTSYDMYIKGFLPATESEYIAHTQLKQNEK